LYILEWRRTPASLRSEQPVLPQSPLRQPRAADAFADLPVGVIVQARDGPVVSINVAARRLLGLGAHEAADPLRLGEGWQIDRREGHAASLGEASETTAKTGKPMSAVLLALMRAGGERRWLSLDTRLAGPGPHEGHVITTLTEVTAHAFRMRDAMAARETPEDPLAELQAYKHAVNKAVMIAVIDDRGRFLHVNGRFCALTGYSREELVGRHYLALRSPTTPSAVLKTIARTLRAGGTWQGELCEIARGGETYWADTTIVPAQGSDGSPGRYVIVRYDVTARRRAETLLSEAIEAVPDGFVIFDENDQLTLYNTAYREAYEKTAPILKEGLTFEEIVRYGLANGQYPSAGETDAEKEAWLAGRLERHRAASSHSLQRLPDGRWMQIREQRAPSGVSVGFRTDVTDLVRQTELLEAIIDNFPGAISYVDHRLIVRHYNAKFKELLGFPDELFADGEVSLEQTFAFNAERGEYGPGDPAQLVADRMALVAKSEPHQFERTRSDGRVLSVHGTPLKGGGFVTSYLDVTERKAMLDEIVRTSQAASEKAKQLSLTLDHMAQGLVMFDACDALSAYNARYAQLFDIDPANIRIGMSAAEMLRQRGESGAFYGDPEERLAAMKARIARGEEFNSTVRTASGRHIHSITAPVPGGGWVTTHEDITERTAALARIHHAAHHDMLTGLENRLSLKDQIDGAFERAQAGGGRFAVMMVDLDRFKSVNDTYGHAVGDEVLKQVAARMRSQLRDGDIVARLGGDEFAILCRTEADPETTAVTMAERLLDAIASPYPVEGKQLVIGASIGIAIAPDHGECTDVLMRNADAALYRVKADGRNGLRVFDEDLHAVARTRRTLEADLRSALELNQFELFYQPVVDLVTRRIVGVEALLRWRHPERGLVSPGHFIPLLEESGLINPVGDWILERACRDGAKMPPHIRVAINVSPVQLRHRSLLGVVEKVLARTGLGAERLELEVTESVLLEKDEALLADLRRLRALGAHIVLDDFGTGYSSLSYIRMFPFDKLKVDKTFVDDLGRNDGAEAVVSAVIGLTKSLDMLSTAEGIETEEQAMLLRAAGCTLGQGYLFGRPVPLSELDFEPRLMAQVS
jgi:diguanylate cyclase (GGDEF)-like protein/PAS domain S-box-containing protein